MQVRQQLLLRKGVVPLPVSFPHLDCAFPLLPGQSAQWDAEPEGTWFSPSTIIKLLVYLSCIIKCQVSCCSCTAVYLKTKIKVGVREEALINLTLLWAKSSLRDYFSTSWTDAWCVRTISVCLCGFFTMITCYWNELDMHHIFYWSLQGQGNVTHVTRSNRVLNTYYCR